MDCDTRHGYEADDDFHHDGKIIYPKCRSTVFPPSEFDARNVARSGKAPDAELELDHVYGYAGVNNTAPNMFYLGTGEVCYYTAAVGASSSTRRSWRNAKSASGFSSATTTTSSAWRSTPTASGSPRVSSGRRPFVCVWDAVTCLQLQRIAHPAGMRGVVALGFSRADGGDHLTAVNSDNSHTVMVWRWSTRGDDAAIDRAKPIPAWSFGPAKRVDSLEFYDEEEGSGAPRASKAATAAPSKAALAGAGSGPPTARTSKSASKSAENLAAAEAAAREPRWTRTPTTGNSATGRTSSRGGTGHQRFPSDGERRRLEPVPRDGGVRDVRREARRVWRRARSSAATTRAGKTRSTDRGSGRWGAERRAATRGFLGEGSEDGEHGEPGGRVRARSHADRHASVQRPDEPSKEGEARRWRRRRRRHAQEVLAQVSSAVSKSMKKLIRDDDPEPPPNRRPNRHPRAQFARLVRELSGPFVRCEASLDERRPRLRRQKSSSAENVLSAAYVRRNVLVTGFPDGALGVWVITRLDANGDAVTDPTRRPCSGGRASSCSASRTRTRPVRRLTSTTARRRTLACVA